MKNMKRAYRRYKNWTKLKKRIKTWTSGGYNPLNTYDGDYHTIEDFRQEIMKGDYYTFLRSTSTPCSCPMCAYDKYKRTQKQYRNKDE